jgi:hypothetical protein
LWLDKKQGLTFSTTPSEKFALIAATPQTAHRKVRFERLEEMKKHHTLSSSNSVQCVGQRLPRLQVEGSGKILLQGLNVERAERSGI